MILNWLTGGGIAAIGEQLNQAYKTKMTAQTDETKLEASILIKQLEARQAILLAEQAHWMTRPIRPLFALPFLIYNMKVVVWDKVLGLGTTDPLGPEMMQMQLYCFSFYFLSRPIEKGINRWLTK